MAEFNPDKPFKVVQETSSAEFNPALPFKSAETAEFDETKPFKIAEAETPGNRGYITTEEISAVAAKHGVSPDELKNIAQLGFGSVVQDTSHPLEAPDALADIAQGAKEAVGVAGQAIAGEIPVFLYKKMQDNPDMRAAIDELGELSYKQKTKAQVGAELLGNVASGVGATKAIGAAGSLLGAGEKVVKTAQAVSGLAGATAMGTASTKEGEEATGAALGFGLGALGEVVLPALMKGIGKAKPAEQKLLKEAAEALEKDAPQIEQKIEQLAQAELPAKDIREGLLLSREGQTALDTLEGFSQSVPPEAEKVFAKNGLQSFADKSDEVKHIIAEEMDKAGLKFEDEKDLQKFMAFKGAQEETIDFAKHLSNGEVPINSYKSAVAAINNKLSTEGEEFLSREIPRWRKASIAKDLIASQADIHAPSDYAKDFFKNSKDFFSDAYTYASPTVDRRLGTNFQGLIDNATAANNKLSMMLTPRYQVAMALEKDAAKKGLSKVQVYNILDTEDLSRLNPEQLEVIQKYAKFAEDGRLLANDMGIPVQKLSNKTYYVPHALLNTPEAVVSLENKAKSLGVYQGLNQADYNTAMKNPEFKELLDGIAIMSGDKYPGNAQLFNQYLKESTNPGIASQRAGSIASAALKREGSIPDFLREKDVTKLFMKWNHNTLRHALSRDFFSEAKRIRNLAVDMGDVRTATYLTDWMKDMSGSANPNGFKAALQLAKSKLQTALIRVKQNPDLSPRAKDMATFMLEAPAIPAMLLRQIYPNYLGMSLKALIPNLIQPLTSGIPEFANTYGTLKLLKGYAQVANTLRQGTMIKVSKELAATKGLKEGEKLLTNELSTILLNEGQLASAPNQAAMNALKGGLAASAPYQMTEKVLNTMSNAAMALYEKSELLNRAVMWHVGQEMAGDIMRGNKGAAEALGGMGPGLKRALDTAVKAGDEEATKRIITQYLESKVIYNYNKESMSAFGRWAGPIFSVFTKWPTSVAGDILNIAEGNRPKSATINLAKKFAAPYALYWLVDKLLLPGQEESDLQKTVLGSGTTRFATVGNVASIIKGDIAKPPVLQAIGNTATALKNIIDNPERTYDILGKTTGDLARAYMPGAGYLNFLSQDLPTLMGQPLEREGNFFEKTKAGIGRLEREVTTGFNKINEYLKSHGKSND